MTTAALSAPIIMETRVALSRPSRLGTRRRRPRAASVLPEAGASRRKAAPSLDTEKQLATSVQNPKIYGRNPDQSVRDWDLSTRSEMDHRREQVALHHQLNGTVHRIWQDHARAGNHEDAIKWEKQWLRLHNCQSEWIAYRAACCGPNTKPIAVPIGCNHRMCPLCAWHRSQLARKRIKSMFDRLTHPALITLTVPNKATIRKHDFTLIRQRVRQFIAQHKPWIAGGIYSLETTYNRAEKTWHIHVHILADLSASLPGKTEKTILAGERVFAFTAIKQKLEFDWLRQWSKSWGKMARSNSSSMRRNGDTYTFEEWIKVGRANRLKEWRGSGYFPIQGLSHTEITARTQWNREHRRVIDLRPVIDRDGAAREVLKYITKIADFCDLPEAVEPFCNAVKGVRLVQTFGSWYGFDAEVLFDPDHLESWGQMKCACGMNSWERMGVFSRNDVEMDTTGQWHLVRAFDHSCRGTVARPTIRALEPVPEVFEGDQLC